MDEIAMDGIVRRIEPKAYWEELALPTQELGALRDLAAQTRLASGGEAKSAALQPARGGVVALFSGPDTAGKLKAAQALAHETQRPLYHVQSAQFVSKYIGETEKNLEQVITRASDSGAILFFDEADALFGKRSEVKDSHDRYANLEVSWLLQRAKSSHGVMILAAEAPPASASDLKAALGCEVHFPLLDEA